MQNSRLIWPINECFWVKGEDLTTGQCDPKGVQPLPILLVWPVHHLTKQWVTSMKRSCLFLIGNLELH